MAKHKLESIEIQNFKAFPANQKIEFNGNHALVWGVNGSGKSSVFWSIYTFLQCAYKEGNEHQKYFDGGAESLHNIYGTGDSFLKLSFKEEGNEAIETLEISTANNEAFTSSFVKGLNDSSEFITHRLLLNFSNFKNSQDVDLYAIFERDIFPFFNTASGKNFQNLLKKIKAELNIESKKNIDNLITEFNDGLEDLIQPLKRGEASRFYRNHLAQANEDVDLQIFFPEPLAYEGVGKNKRLKNPVVSLKVKFGFTGSLLDINKPQSYFNEARINAIALAIRFVLMEKRKNSDELNLLVLDDLLISLDLHNRKKVIDLILSKYSQSYQIIILTHDKGFFNEFIRQISDDIDNWNVIRLFETNLNENPKIDYDKSGNLDKAISYYALKDYESCALYLRKEAEETLSKYINPDLKFIWASKEWKGLADFLTGAEKKYLNGQIIKIKKLAYENDITQEEFESLKEQFEIDADIVADQAKHNRLKSFKRTVFATLKELKRQKELGADVFDLMQRMKHIKDRILNAGAHFSEAPFFQQEIEDAIRTIIQLRGALTNQDTRRFIEAFREAGMNI